MNAFCCLVFVSRLNSRSVYTDQANKDIAPSCSKDWTDLDIYLKHNAGENAISKLTLCMHISHAHISFSIFVKFNFFFS